MKTRVLGVLDQQDPSVMRRCTALRSHVTSFLVTFSFIFLLVCLAFGIHAALLFRAFCPLNGVHHSTPVVISTEFEFVWFAILLIVSSSSFNRWSLHPILMWKQQKITVGLKLAASLCHLEWPGRKPEWGFTAPDTSSEFSIQTS